MWWIMIYCILEVAYVLNESQRSSFSTAQVLNKIHDTILSTLD